MTRHHFFRSVSVLLVIAMLTGCTGIPQIQTAAADIAETVQAQPAPTGSGPDAAADDETENSEPSVYRFLYGSEVSTLNYLITGNANDYAVSANLVDCLVDYDRYGNIVPGLAESWESNEDRTEWTFHIRPGVQWVDCEGNPVADVQADDWVAAAEYVNNAANGSASRYMYNTGAVVHNAQAYYNYTAWQVKTENGTKNEDEEGNPIEPAAEVRPEEIGVSAPDPLTLVYELDQPCPFFLSVLSYTSYMPVCRAFLEDAGDSFGLDHSLILYNGAYILSEYEPQEKRTLVRNTAYWDADHVYIDEIRGTYHADITAVETQLYRNGEIDSATINADLLDAWMADEEMKDQVHSARPDNSYSYFYAFNFDPQFDASYEPDNWRLAVCNENFRKAVMAAFDRDKALAVIEPYAPAILRNNTVTPASFVSADGLDYTRFAALADITEGDSFDPGRAVAYRDEAMAELAAEGAVFPVKVLMPYNPSTTNWDRECQVVEQQIEGVLGTDFIDIIIEPGPETGFLSAVRRSGNYAFMKCNWGADYADPQTWTEPFADGNSYNFWYQSGNEEVQALFEEHEAMVAEAGTISDHEAERYTAFAAAERMLIDHAIIIPFSILGGGGYQVSKLDPFEGEFAPYGLANFRYKHKKVHADSMSMDEFAAAMDAWEAERAASLAE